ncbi:thioredoxin [Moraxella ovis]|uniref:Thioredoxin n=1 Tax=Moraxella ovis TaxID=29433 RepID=A0A378PKQ7_9GAMM|nr:thioredoxin family protein [Moraxella ovis]ANB91680.1 thioredoxin [Moraxella ovis]STY87344.1 thioredoxin [Moraxella ovis]
MRIVEDLGQIEQTITEHGIVLLYVQAPNCGVCKVFLERVRGMEADFDDVQFMQTNIADVPSIAGRFHVLTAPAVLVFLLGKEMYRGARYLKLDEIKEVLQDCQSLQ